MKADKFMERGDVDIERSMCKELRTTSFDVWQSASLAARSWLRAVQATSRCGLGDNATAWEYSST